MPVGNWIINGSEIVASASLEFPFDDCGFLYGYGLFETVKVFNKTPLLLANHLGRLQRSSIVMDLMLDIDTEKLIALIYELIKKNGIENGVLNLYLTGGDRPTSMYHLGLEKPTLIGVVREFSFDKLAPLTLGLRQASFQRIPIDGIKTMSWFKNILEKRLAPEFNDIILYDNNDLVLETTTANIFFIKKNKLVTPKAAEVLMGVTRSFILEISQKQLLEVEERLVNLSELTEFDELFITNAVHGVIEIDSVENHEFLRSGSVTQSIKQKYMEEIHQLSQSSSLV
tara:strand:- start:194 stop:1048 length:855 start_codon:yes stop_codon:yes gene_type:complete